MTTPVDDYLEGNEKNAAVRDAKDKAAWEAWKQDPKPNNLTPLMKRFDSEFGKKTRLWKAPNVDEASFKANLQQQALKAFKSYDPNRGASLRTHVIGHLPKAQRFNISQQNNAYIPEQKTELIGPIDQAADRLRDQLGRDPSHAEIGAALGRPAKLIKEVQGLRRADISASRFESDPVSRAGSRHEEVVGLLRPTLKGDDQAVFDYLYGQGGKPKVTSTSAIAQRMGKSPSQVSRLKRRVEAEYKKYI